jgi:hypothetical protein
MGDLESDYFAGTIFDDQMMDSDLYQTLIPEAELELDCSLMKNKQGY